MLKTGKFDSRTTPRKYHIPPFGYADLGSGVGTLSLVSCDAVALQLVCDGHAMRVNEGSTMPMNGHNRYLRNPYSRHVRCETLEDLPVQIGRRHAETDAGFAAFHKHSMSFKGGGLTGYLKGICLMAKRGVHAIEAEGTSDLSISLLPNANPVYADRLPDGVLAGDSHIIDSKGGISDNLIGLEGKYTEAQLAEWIVSSGWNDQPVPITRQQSQTSFVLGEDTAVLMHNREGETTHTNVVITDLGDWNPQLDG